MRASLIITFEWSIYHVLYVMYYKYLYIYEYIKNIYPHLKDSRDESTSKNEKKKLLCVKQKQKVKHFKAFSGKGKEMFGLEVNTELKYYLCCVLFNLWTQ